MANYYGNTRTNYFRVTDEVKLKEILEYASVDEDELEIWEKTINGEKHFAFGGYGCLNYYKETEDETINDVEDLYQKLMTVVHPEDAIIITEVGNEKLRYLVGSSMIITSTELDHVDLYDVSISTAKKLLNNESYETEITY